MTRKRAIVRYHGGKSKLAPWIVSQMPAHQCYVEPFGGGASVLLTKGIVPTEIYNDIDDEIVNTFQVIRDHTDELIRLVENTLYSRTDWNIAHEESADKIERARRFLVRSHMSVSTAQQSKSGFRSAINCKDYCSQASTWNTLSNIIPFVRNRLRNVIIEHCDAFALFDRYDRTKTLWFLDPPYKNELRSKSSISRGYANNLSDNDHERLLIKCKTLTGKVMISGYDSDMYNDLLAGWEKAYAKSYTDSKALKTEVLWKNFPSPHLLF